MCILARAIVTHLLNEVPGQVSRMEWCGDQDFRLTPSRGCVEAWETEIPIGT